MTRSCPDCPPPFCPFRSRAQLSDSFICSCIYLSIFFFNRPRYLLPARSHIALNSNWLRIKGSPERGARRTMLYYTILYYNYYYNTIMWRARDGHALTGNRRNENLDLRRFDSGSFLISRGRTCSLRASSSLSGPIPACFAHSDARPRPRLTLRPAIL